MNANHITKKIEMTKTEAKTAGKPYTDAYNTLLELMIPPRQQRDSTKKWNTCGRL